jgi:hypothetical protein
MAKDGEVAPSFQPLLESELFSPTESTNYKHLSIACMMVNVVGGSGSQKVTHFTED